MSHEPIMLYIVATPIGNLKDITLRAIETLKSVDLIACEDTRHSKILLDNYGIKTATTSFFQHNRFTKGQYLINLLLDGKNIALISDAGMPGVLDPGYNLINLAIENNIPISVLPGACALIDALVLSGLPAHEFFFAGFLPQRSQARKNKLENLKNLGTTVVFYESPHRMCACLEDMLCILGDIKVTVIRELTKKFEEIKSDYISELIQNFKTSKPKGEFVIVFNPRIKTI